METVPHYLEGSVAESSKPGGDAKMQEEEEEDEMRALLKEIKRAEAGSDHSNKNQENEVITQSRAGKEKDGKKVNPIPVFMPLDPGKITGSDTIPPSLQRQETSLIPERWGYLESENNQSYHTFELERHSGKENEFILGRAQFPNVRGRARISRQHIRLFTVVKDGVEEAWIENKSINGTRLNSELQIMEKDGKRKVSDGTRITIASADPDNNYPRISFILRRDYSARHQHRRREPELRDDSDGGEERDAIDVEDVKEGDVVDDIGDQEEIEENDVGGDDECGDGYSSSDSKASGEVKLTKQMSDVSPVKLDEAYRKSWKDEINRQMKIHSPRKTAKQRDKALVDARGILGSETLSLYPFGSHGNGFDLRDSDLDVTILIGSPQESHPDDQKKTKALQLLKQVRRKLQAHAKQARKKAVGKSSWRQMAGCFSKCMLIAARVPVMKVVHVQTSIEVDIVANNRTGVHNTALLRKYAEMHPQVQRLGRLLKIWTKSYGINSAASGHISSYGWVLLAIFYLQVRGLIPSLQAKEHLSRSQYLEISGLDCTFCREKRTLAGIKERAKEKFAEVEVEDLLLGFFEYYSKLDWCGVKISPRLACLLRRQKRYSPKHKSHMKNVREIWLEDPFEVHLNLGRHITMQTYQEIMHSLRSGYHLMKIGPAKPFGTLVNKRALPQLQHSHDDNEEGLNAVQEEKQKPKKKKKKKKKKTTTKKPNKSSEEQEGKLEMQRKQLIGMLDPEFANRIVKALTSCMQESGLEEIGPEKDLPDLFERLHWKDKKEIRAARRNIGYPSLVKLMEDLLLSGDSIDILRKEEEEEEEKEEEEKKEEENKSKKSKKIPYLWEVEKSDLSVVIREMIDPRFLVVLRKEIERCTGVTGTAELGKSDLEMISKHFKNKQLLWNITSMLDVLGWNRGAFYRAIMKEEPPQSATSDDFGYTQEQLSRSS